LASESPSPWNLSYIGAAVVAGIISIIAWQYYTNPASIDPILNGTTTQVQPGNVGSTTTTTSNVSQGTQASVNVGGTSQQAPGPNTNVPNLMQIPGSSTMLGSPIPANVTPSTQGISNFKGVMNGYSTAAINPANVAQSSDSGNSTANQTSSRSQNNAAINSIPVVSPRTTTYMTVAPDVVTLPDGTQIPIETLNQAKMYYEYTVQTGGTPTMSLMADSGNVSTITINNGFMVYQGYSIPVSYL
jgi:hypothetical protein